MPSSSREPPLSEKRRALGGWRLCDFGGSLCLTGCFISRDIDDGFRARCWGACKLKRREWGWEGWERVEERGEAVSDVQLKNRLHGGIC